MARSPSLSRDWSRAWPSRVAHRSRLLSCASPASPALSTLLQSPRRHLATLPGLLHPQPRPPRLPALQRLRPTPMMTGTLSSMHVASPRLPVALRPPSPSRPTPLELVGAPATSAAAVCARPPSALCGGRSDVLSLRAFGWCGVQLRLCLLRRCWASFSLATRGFRGSVAFSPARALWCEIVLEGRFSSLENEHCAACFRRAARRRDPGLHVRRTLPCPRLPWRILSTLSRILSTRSPTL